MNRSFGLVFGPDRDPGRPDPRSEWSYGHRIARRKRIDEDVHERVNSGRDLEEKPDDRAVNLADALLAAELFRVGRKVGLLESVLVAFGALCLRRVEWLIPSEPSEKNGVSDGGSSSPSWRSPPQRLTSRYPRASRPLVKPVLFQQHECEGRERALARREVRAESDQTYVAKGRGLRGGIPE